MDTDDLTEMAYRIIVLAERANDCLASEIGARASGYQNEQEFLEGTKKIVGRIIDSPRRYLESWSLENEVDVKVFKKNAAVITEHIDRTLATPIEKRD